jgi:uncharacterized membrane protein
VADFPPQAFVGQSPVSEVDVEDLLQRWTGYLALLVETISVVFIAIGSMEAVWMLLKRRREGRRKAVWVRFGVWLILSLEFQLGADIIRTAISPTWMQIGQLSAIAAIRTFLNHFLEKDLEKYAVSVEKVTLPTDKAA